MRILRLEDSMLARGEAVERIKKEVELFSEVYYSPQKEGVKSISVPYGVKLLLQDRLNYMLKCQQEFKSNNGAQLLIAQLLNIGEILGYTPSRVRRSEHRAGIDLAKVFSRKDGIPFFIWGPAESLIDKIGLVSPLTEELWAERETEFIYDSRAKFPAPIAPRDKPSPNRYLPAHKLSFNKQDLRKGTDTRLTLACSFYPEEGFAYHTDFHIRDGELVGITDGNECKDACQVHDILNSIETELGVAPQHLLFYIEHSNLTNKHKKQIGEVIDILSKYPEILPYKLFDGQKRWYSSIAALFGLGSKAEITTPAHKTPISTEKTSILTRPQDQYS